VTVIYNSFVRVLLRRNVTTLRYLVNVGRPREHDEATASALLAAAERTVYEQGADALSVRGVADAVGTSTRAVYSLFGSKDGLIAALGARVFELLGLGLDALAPTDDPGADLVAAGLMFREVVIGHPALFAIGMQKSLTPGGSPVVRAAASAAWDELEQTVRRLSDAGRLDGRGVDDAMVEFHALCEGLAALELRGALGPRPGDRIWRDGLTALVNGFAGGR
jgi:AcrR family transcriptional regulator